MKIRKPSCASDDELRQWAYDADADEPTPDWDLVLCWSMVRGRLRLIAELADDAACPHADFFLLVLYRWIDYLCRDRGVDTAVPKKESHFDEIRGVRNPKVKRWRHQALRMLQGIEPYDRERWWQQCFAEMRNEPID